MGELLRFGKCAACSKGMSFYPLFPSTLSNLSLPYTFVTQGVTYCKEDGKWIGWMLSREGAYLRPVGKFQTEKEAADAQ